jgi:hypothetical protein
LLRIAEGDLEEGYEVLSANDIRRAIQLGNLVIDWASGIIGK